ncbi:MAG: glycosyltransferase family 2 protein [Porticoccaceae bacterium]|nr:glycosyltransferase family 2 protein [Porticoccaceae bacterium]
MNRDYPPAVKRWRDPLVSLLLRVAASGWAPPSWFRPPLPEIHSRTAHSGNLNIEIVSHCWQYAHFLVYQLSSLVRFPPQRAQVTMTVYYCEEDEETAALLAYFGAMKVSNVRWQWRSLPRRALFRRGIGRNEAALATPADWIWFTDCDLMFREGCLDGLVTQLQGRRDALVYPRIERVTPLLADQDVMLNPNLQTQRLADVDDTRFTELPRDRATGPLQITHGDVARAVGYCARLHYYQRPSETWCKAREDRAFRWLLGTQGTPLDIPGVYRIRHESKGRYTGSTRNTKVRGAIRRFAMRFKEGK